MDPALTILVIFSLPALILLVFILCWQPSNTSQTKGSKKETLLGPDFSQHIEIPPILRLGSKGVIHWLNDIAAYTLQFRCAEDTCYLFVSIPEWLELKSITMLKELEFGKDANQLLYCYWPEYKIYFVLDKK